MLRKFDIFSDTSTDNRGTDQRHAHSCAVHMYVTVHEHKYSLNSTMERCVQCHYKQLKNQSIIHIAKILYIS